jgi:hypothetical protein
MAKDAILLGEVAARGTTMTGMRNTLAAALAMTLVTGAAPTQPDYTGKERWRWLCTPSGYYGMTVAPDGKYQPKVDLTDTEAFELSVYEMSEAMRAECGVTASLQYPSYSYVVRIKGNVLSEYFPGWSGADFCGQTVSVSPLPHQGHLEDLEVTTTHPGMAGLQVERADFDWRFTFTSGGVTTDRDAARVNATLPQGAPRLSPEATTWMLTGTCKLVVGQ